MKFAIIDALSNLCTSGNPRCSAALLPAALLSYVLGIESMQTEAIGYTSNLPQDRADAIVQGLIDIGATLENTIDYHNNEQRIDVTYLLTRGSSRALKRMIF